MLMTAGCRGSVYNPERSLERAKDEQRRKISRKRSKPLLKTTLGFDFSADVILESLQIHPYKAIRGKVVVENCVEKPCAGIRVQLEAIVCLEETTFKVGIRDVNNFTCNIIKGSKDLGLSKTNPFFFSPLGCQLLGNPFAFDESCPSGDTTLAAFTLNEGTSTFPFEITMPDDSLPSPFRKRQASLDFRVAAYLKHSIYYVEMASVSVDFPGFRNLFPHSAPEPLSHETIVPGTKTKLILRTFDSKFVPGEDILFTLSVISKKTNRRFVEKATVSLVKKIQFNISGVCRVGSTCLNQIETTEMDNDNGTLSLAGKLNVPLGSGPSFNEASGYHITYLVQSEVKLVDSLISLKGAVQVTIGTTRDNPEVVQLYDFLDFRNCIGQMEEIRIGGMRNAESIQSAISDISLYSLPPAYSQLSSRAMSLTSVETLPPHYEDLQPPALLVKALTP